MNKEFAKVSPTPFSDTLPHTFAKTKGEMTWLINVALATAKIRKLTVQEPNIKYNLRPSLHVILQSKVSSTKSTILEQIGSEITKPILTEITRPGLVGTIDQKTMQLIPGASWECRNSLMLIDEVSFSDKDNSYDAFLMLLEQQKYSKRFGLFSASQETKDKDLYLRVDKGQIDIKTRFSCIMATMKRLEYMRGQRFRALMTRVVPYQFDLNEEDLNKIAEGHSLVTIQDTKIDPEIHISLEDYQKIKELVNKELSKCSTKFIREELFLRSIGDACRIYAVTKSMDKIPEVISWKIKAQELIGKYYKDNPGAKT